MSARLASSGKLRTIREVTIKGLEQHILVVLEEVDAPPHTPAAPESREASTALKPLGWSSAHPGKVLSTHATGHGAGADSRSAVPESPSTLREGAG